MKTLARDAEAALLAYGWPGNVRELANVMERVVLLSDGDQVTAATLDLPRESVRSAGVGGEGPGTRGKRGRQKGRRGGSPVAGGVEGGAGHPLRGAGRRAT